MSAVGCQSPLVVRRLHEATARCGALQADAVTENANFFLGRQPILNQLQEIVAYELLFRAGHTLTANVTDDLQATSAVIINTAQLGLHHVLDRRDGFINVSRDLLLSDMLELLPRHCTVLEILESVTVDDEVVERCRELKAMGFRLALDDFEYTPAYDALFELIDFIKLDVLALDAPKLEATLLLLDSWPHIQRLAEKVEDMEMFERCTGLGFTMFQGYFFARPAILSGRKAHPNQIVLSRVTGLLMSDAELPEIELAFKGCPALTLGLLRLVNSVSVGSNRKIETLKQALLVLGRKQLQCWVQLLMYAQDNRSAADNPLLQMVALRAKIMELLSQRHTDVDHNNAHAMDKAFMVGMLSKVDVVMDMTLDEILGQMGVTGEVVDAILQREGFYGQLLALVEALEAGDFVAAEVLLESIGFTLEVLCETQLEAMDWASNLGVEATH